MSVIYVRGVSDRIPACQHSTWSRPSFTETAWFPYRKLQLYHFCFNTTHIEYKTQLATTRVAETLFPILTAQFIHIHMRVLLIISWGESETNSCVYSLKLQLVENTYCSEKMFVSVRIDRFSENSLPALRGKHLFIKSDRLSSFKKQLPCCAALEQQVASSAARVKTEPVSSWRPCEREPL